MTVISVGPDHPFLFFWKWKFEHEVRVVTNDKQELERELTQRVQILAPLPDAGPWERFKTTSTH